MVVEGPEQPDIEPHKLGNKAGVHFLLVNDKLPHPSGLHVLASLLYLLLHLNQGPQNSFVLLLDFPVALLVERVTQDGLPACGLDVGQGGAAGVQQGGEQGGAHVEELLVQQA